MPHLIETIFYLCDLIKCDGGPGITFHTAGTLADTKVTTELLRQNF